MKASFFCTNTYLSAEPFRYPGWPTPPRLYRSEIGLKSVDIALEQATLADQLGFDWVSCSEHHYTPLLQTPNAAVFAAALSQVVKRAKIAVLGPLVSMNNPVRIAEELAMLDQLSHGRLVVLFLRGTPNEFLAYGTNPDETRARTQEASVLITRALTEPEPFGWEGRFFRFRTVSVWPGPIQRPHPPMFYSGQQLRIRVLRGQAPSGVGYLVLPGDPGGADHRLLQARVRQARMGADRRPASVSCVHSGGRGRPGSGDAAGQVFRRRWRAELFKGRGAAVPPPSAPTPIAVGTDGDGKNTGADNGPRGFGLGELRFCGSPDTVVKQFADFHAATGAGVIDISFGGAGLTMEETMKSIRLFGTEVIPRIGRIGAYAANGMENLTVGAE
jgi:alkanesulfonate monooxygenase SsuD/methylene tetrahydromethanopterin reductase-like flavin-dependent oxidoreductase (luciferase family)